MVVLQKDQAEEDGQLPRQYKEAKSQRATYHVRSFSGDENLGCNGWRE